MELCRVARLVGGQYAEQCVELFWGTRIDQRRLGGRGHGLELGTSSCLCLQLKLQVFTNTKSVSIAGLKETQNAG